MEVDVCDENVSPTLVDRADNTVVTENTDSHSSAPSIVGLESTEKENVANDILCQTAIQSDLKPTSVRSSLDENDSNDYYEVISADGSIGEDDVHNDNHDKQIHNFRTSKNVGLAVSDDIDRSSSRAETCSFGDLPFVPKFEFPLDLNENKNETASKSNYGILSVKRLIPRPDKNFTIPPPNFQPIDIKPSLLSVDPIHVPLLNSKIHELANISNDKNVSSVVHSSDSDASRTVPVDDVVRNLPGPSSVKESVVDWLDENGDPVPGAFDYVKPDESNLNVKNSKVEYVFSVREKRYVPDEQNDFVNSNFLINQNVLHKNVAGILGVPLENQLVPGPSGIVNKVYGDEEKKLYEASKSGSEYKAAVNAVTTSTSTDTSTNDIPGNENAKKVQLPKFRRNRFTDIRKDETKPDETSVEEKVPKTKEEAALESQAVTEILREVQRGAARAKEHGALGWQRCPVPVTNKTFLRNTLVSTLREPYKPPSKRGRFHVGLKGNEDKGQHHTKREADDSRSSRSRSRSSSRSRSGSYSRSRSGSSSPNSRSRDRHKNFNWRGGRGSWHGGQNQYYDEAWAAYAAQYGGYPWYGPEAFPMFYGPEEWPMDPYAAMYYGNPQAWMEYEAYYGPQNFGPRGMGRGFRGRGRGDRGRGRGGYDGGFREFNEGFQSPSREYSRSRSRSSISRSWSRDRSHSRALSVHSKSGHRSRSLSRGRSRSRSRSHHRSEDRSVRRESDGKSRSDAEINEKKKKKKKKKKKHKKTKKSKHREKDDENKKDVEENADAEKGEILNKIDSKSKYEGKKDSISDLEKADATLKRGKGKQHKLKNQDNNEKEGNNKEKAVNAGKSKHDDGIVYGNISVTRDNVSRQKEKDKVTEESNKIHFDSQKKNSKETDMKEQKRREKSEEKDDRKKRKRSSDSYEKYRIGEFSGSKSKEKTKEVSDVTAKERRSESQDRRKRSRSKDNGSKDGRSESNERNRKESHKYRLGRDDTNRDRSGSRDSRERTRIQGHKRKLDGDSSTDVAPQDRSTGSKRIISDQRNASARIKDSDGRDSRESDKKIGHQYRYGRDVTEGARSQSKERNRKDGHRKKDRNASPVISDREWNNKSSNSKDVTRKDTLKYTDRTADNTYPTNIDNKRENYGVKHRSKDDQKYKVRNDSSDIIDRKIDSKGRSRLDIRQKNLESDEEDEDPIKRIICLKTKPQDKRNTNDTKDEYVDKPQTGKISNSVDASSRQERGVRTDGKVKNDESRDGKGDNSQIDVKNGNKDRMKTDKNLITGREIKGASEREIDSGKERTGKNADHGYLKDTKKKFHENKQDRDRKRLDKEKYKASDKPEKLLTQLNSENDITASKKQIGLEDLHLTRKASTDVVYNTTKLSNKMKVATSKKEGVTKDATEKMQMSGNTSVKRKKKVIKKLVGAKKLKHGDMEETLDIKDPVAEDVGEVSKLRKKKVKPIKKLTEESQQDKHEISSEVGIE